MANSESNLRLWGRLSWAAVSFFLAVGVCWLLRVPSVGKGGLFLAMAAILLPLFWERIGTAGKMLWIGTLFVLLAVEYRAIDKDQREKAEAQKNELEAIGNGFTNVLANQQTEFSSLIEQGRRQFAEMVKKENTQFTATMNGVADSISIQTGGDSFAFISFTAQAAQSFEMHWNNFTAPRGQPYFVVSVTSHGKYPLRSTHAIIMDDERRLAAMQEYNEHPSGDWMQKIHSADTEYQFPYLRPQSPEAPSGQVDVIGMYPMAEGDSKRLTINFAALNGYWNEALHLGRVNGIWHQCLSVVGPTVEQANHPFVWCDSIWPEGKNLALKDWIATPSIQKEQAREASNWYQAIKLPTYTITKLPIGVAHAHPLG